ncbi:MAG: KilA-N domain-containing protein [Bacteroidales bacterium]|uniref:KilA-N domain-containing protein n=1 Tax=Porphyromonas sp. TaxID=1924944 RepID=UPI002975DED4|nr:KilA-N domain-containing protein [Porphyromonas sp.]MDD7437876.1 KilA-N domain-containing protein [Bacteroidales bacterium]MDY3066375.1 KilA-N domain-containing protein [Porphyromonas sp.]
MVQKALTSIFAYDGNNITFLEGDNLMINATQMAKAFGKQPIYWLRNDSTKEFLKTYSVLQNCSTEELVQVKQGGADQGTWMHEDIALEFARWLSPMFAIWCNNRIKELLLHGTTSLPLTDIAGVKPIYSDGREWFYGRDLMVAVGNSRNSGTLYGYKLRYPGECATINGRNYISRHLALLIQTRANNRLKEAEIMQSLNIGKEEV